VNRIAQRRGPTLNSLSPGIRDASLGADFDTVKGWDRHGRSYRPSGKQSSPGSTACCYARLTVNPRKLFHRIATSQTNVRFGDLVRLTEALGFLHDRTTGSHHVFIHRQHTTAQLNLQPDGSQAKPYQVRQLVKLIEEYNLTLDRE